MTEKEFYQALRRGLGSAIVMLQNAQDKSIYRDIVLRCCLRDISYDWQSEGSKGYYLYQAIVALDEKDYFEPLIIKKFMSVCSDRLFFQLADILHCYSHDGSKITDKAFCDKYNYFMDKNGRLSKRHSKDIDEGYQWDEVTYQLFFINGFYTFEHYAKNVGRILLKNPNSRKIYNLYDDWFFARAKNFFGEKKIDDFLEHAYEKSVAIKALVDTLKSDKTDIEQTREERKKISINYILQYTKEEISKNPPYKKVSRTMGYYKNVLLPPWFINNISKDEFLELAQITLHEKNETIKALLLSLFRLERKPFPLDIAPLLEYTQSDNELLAEAAIRCLQSFKDKRIHELAVQLLETKGLDSSALSLFRKNYKKSDDELIKKLIKKLSTIPHHVHSDIVCIYTHYRSANALPTLLHVYYKGICAFCREGIVRAMHHCKVLPDNVLMECLHDSNNDIRNFAKRIIKKRKDKDIAIPPAFPTKKVAMLDVALDSIDSSNQNDE